MSASFSASVGERLSSIRLSRNELMGSALIRYSARLMTITAAAPLAGSNLSAASMSPFVSTEMTLAIEPRSAEEASVSGSGASAFATLAIAIALKITETANQTKRRRTGTAGSACSKWSIADSSPMRSMPTAASAWNARLRCASRRQMCWLRK